MIAHARQDSRPCSFSSGPSAIVLDAHRNAANNVLPEALTFLVPHPLPPAAPSTAPRRRLADPFAPPLGSILLLSEPATKVDLRVEVRSLHRKVRYFRTELKVNPLPVDDVAVAAAVAPAGTAAKAVHGIDSRKARPFHEDLHRVKLDQSRLGSRGNCKPIPEDTRRTDMDRSASAVLTPRRSRNERISPAHIIPRSQAKTPKPRPGTSSRPLTACICFSSRLVSDPFEQRERRTAVSAQQ